MVWSLPGLAPSPSHARGQEAGRGACQFSPSLVGGKPGLPCLEAEHLPAEKSLRQVHRAHRPVEGGTWLDVAEASQWLPHPPRPGPGDAARRWRPNILRPRGTPAGCVGMAKLIPNPGKRNGAPLVLTSQPLPSRRVVSYSSLSL